MFTNILTDANLTESMGVLICTLSSLAIGFMISFCSMFKAKCSRNFSATLVILPIIVMAVIMLVNGNVGAGVAVMGAFSLVRFRSVPGTSREITSLFLAMAAGLATGMGYIGFAFIITAVVCIVLMILAAVGFGKTEQGNSVLRIIVPEDMDFEGAFDDILEKYTSSASLESVKTVSMGSLYEIKYTIVMKEGTGVKAMIDDIRCRNGNLTVSCGRKQTVQEEL